METVPLRFNSHLGGGFLKNYWWVILIIVIILVAIGAYFAFSGNSNSNSKTVSLQKKIVDGEEVYIKTVNGEEVPLTDQDKITADNTAKNAIASGNNIAINAIAFGNNIAKNAIASANNKALQETQDLAQQAVTQVIEASKLASEIAIPSE